MTAITCVVCPRACKLEEGQTGYCNVRKNINGKNVDGLYGLLYPYPEEYNQFAPGSYTIVFPGCPLKCWFCDVPFVSSGFNGDVSEWPSGAYRKLTPHEVVERVKKSAGPERAGFKSGLMGLFGGEPTIHYEYLLEAGQICHEAGCASKIHTSGFVSEEIMRKVAGCVNVISLNVKGSCSPEVYRRMDAKPDAVLRSIEAAWQTPCVDGLARDKATFTIRNIVGPDMEPSEEETYTFGKWLVDKTDPSILVLIESVFAPTERFLDRRIEQDTFLPGDDDGKAFLRMWSVGTALFQAGLENVWVNSPGWANVHVPTTRLDKSG